MDTKRAVLAGALLWVLVFFEVSILMFGFNIQVPSRTYYLLHLPLFAILVIASSLVYFRDKREGGVKNGLFLGMTFLLVGIVLDSLITIPLFVKDYSFFLRTEMLAGFLEMIVVTTAVGALKK